ncbi:Regulation of nuclear pre-mRNA domain containing protein 1B [Geranomyces michiganensis]|nr:Regulation of nuclear pre-mRNA domain containing protein 1B [Geranomyces michiganensis]
MANYSDAALTQKLAKLVDTQDSITVLGQCVKHAASSVQTWARELHKASPSRKLCFLYLANDVVQNSRRKGDEFAKEFAKVFPETLPHVYRHTPPETQQKIGRILDILEERRIYPPEFVRSIKQNLGKRASITQSPTKQSSSSSQPLHPVTSPVIQPGNKITGDVAAIAGYLDEIKQLDLAKAQQSTAMSINVGDDAENMDSVIAALAQYRITLDDDIAKRTALTLELQTLQERMLLFVQGDRLALQKCNERIASLNARRLQVKPPHSSSLSTNTAQSQLPSPAASTIKAESSPVSPAALLPTNQSRINDIPAQARGADTIPQTVDDVQQPVLPHIADPTPPQPSGDAYVQPFSVAPAIPSTGTSAIATQDFHPDDHARIMSPSGQTGDYLDPPPSISRSAAAQPNDSVPYTLNSPSDMPSSNAPVDSFGFQAQDIGEIPFTPP